MLIRTQDREDIVNMSSVNFLKIEQNCKQYCVFAEMINSSNCLLGLCSTEERALQVLDEIQVVYTSVEYVLGEAVFDYPKIYKMPKDEEKNNEQNVYNQ